MDKLPNWFQDLFVNLLAAAIWALLVWGVIIFRKQRILQTRIKAWKVLIPILVLLLVIITLVIRIIAFPPRIPPQAALIGLRYAVADYDPRLLDIRTASTEGIPLYENDSFSIENLWVSVIGETKGYTIVVRCYADQQLIGVSEAPVSLREGLIQIGAPIPTSFQDDEVSLAWNVQASWQTLTVELNIYDEDRKVRSEKTVVSINREGTAWIWDAPYARFASITYTVNEGLPVILDSRTAETRGIDATVGDQLTLNEVWYDSDSLDPDAAITLEGYVSPGDYDGESYQVSRSSEIQKGSHRLDNYSALTWQVRPNDKYWIISLLRDDKTLLDRFKIPLNSGVAAGLMEAASAVNWHDNNALYIDFESTNDLSAWAPNGTNTIARSSSRAFTGAYSLEVTVTTADEEDYRQIFWNQEIEAEAIVGQVYLPRQSGIDVIWAQICAWACVPIDLQTERWNTFALDLSELTINDNALNTITIPRLWIQMQLSGVTPETPYQFFVDGIQYYSHELP